MIVATKSAHKKLARPLQRMSRFLPAKAMLYRFSQCKAKRVEQSKEICLCWLVVVRIRRVTGVVQLFVLAVLIVR